MNIRKENIVILIMKKIMEDLLKKRENDANFGRRIKFVKKGRILFPNNLPGRTRYYRLII